MASGHVRHVAAPAGVALLIAAMGVLPDLVSARQQAGARPDQDAQLVAEFSRRVQEYAVAHRKLEATLPDLPAKATPQQVDTHQRSLGRLISQARAKAQHGDLFTREGRAYFRRQIARSMGGPDAAQIRSSIMDENPGRIQLRINSRYPDDIPLSTMPPGMLAALPKLPEELEYRFLGERLILLDVHAHLLVDYIDDALPR